jgi:hypothetical protein
MNPMGWFTRLALTVALIGGAILFELMREGADSYNMPVAKARELLKSAELPDYVLGSEPKTFDVDTRDPGKIVWIVKDGGREAMRFTALLSPVDAASTKVRVEVTGPTSGPFGDVQRRLRDYRTIRHLCVMAMKERVAATLERRDFNFSAVMPATALATMSALFGLAASNALEKTGIREAAVSERAPQNINRAARP